MSKFLVTKNPPEILEKGEFVIGPPDFRLDIQAARTKKPKSNLLTVNYLREVIAAIGAKYLGEDFDALRDINVSKYVGIPCESEEQIHDVLVKAFSTQHPQLIYATVLHQFKQRPSGTSLIYFTADPYYSTKLIELGLEQITLKELEKLRSSKTKKVVGKPTITNKETADLDAGDV